MSPNPAWVDALRPATRVTGKVGGTGTMGAVKLRPSGVSSSANGQAASSASSSSGLQFSPSNLSHSCPGRMFITPRNVSSCSFDISPAWLSLCPANGRPMPLIVYAMKHVG